MADETLNTLAVKLSLEDSRCLLAELEKQELPWGLLYLGSGLFEVEIDGFSTVHILDIGLDDPDGWCMRTHIVI